MSTIIVALDLKSNSYAVLETSTELATSLSADLVLTTVEPLLAGSAGATESELLSEIRDEYGDDINTIHDLAASIQEDGINCRAILLEGNPANEIVELGNKLEAKMIVLGTHGHSTLYDTLIGSASPGVIHNANRPVVLVPQG